MHLVFFISSVVNHGNGCFDRVWNSLTIQSEAIGLRIHSCTVTLRPLVVAALGAIGPWIMLTNEHVEGGTLKWSTTDYELIRVIEVSLWTKTS